MHPFPHHYVVSSKTAPEGDVVLESEGLPPLATLTPPEFGAASGLRKRCWLPPSPTAFC
jgi:hypothetical protein